MAASENVTGFSGPLFGDMSKENEEEKKRSKKNVQYSNTKKSN